MSPGHPDKETIEDSVSKEFLLIVWNEPPGIAITGSTEFNDTIECDLELQAPKKPHRLTEMEYVQPALK